jgi:hypothetical protein
LPALSWISCLISRAGRDLARLLRREVREERGRGIGAVLQGGEVAWRRCRDAAPTAREVRPGRPHPAPRAANVPHKLDFGASELDADFRNTASPAFPTNRRLEHDATS